MGFYSGYIWGRASKKGEESDSYFEKEVDEQQSSHCAQCDKQYNSLSDTTESDAIVVVMLFFAFIIVLAIATINYVAKILKRYKKKIVH